MPIQNEEIGKWLKAKRQHLGLSLKKVSQRAGISYSHLYAIEDGTVRPSIDTLLRIAEALYIPKEEVFDMLGLSRPAEQRLVLAPFDTTQIEINPPIPMLVQVVATVPCGKPIEIEGFREPLGFIPVHEDEYRRGARFAVRAEGDSMMPEIKAGDFLLIRPQTTASDGDIVLVSIETSAGWESAVKRYRTRDGKIVLESLNPAYPPIEVAPPMRLRIIGRVVELKRFL